jgi:ABC-type Fe3+-hydroxamate transport system substrate-binding protein
MKFTDQIGREIKINQIPKRIVSLVPSQSELLFDLEVGERVVGITKFCIHPKEWQNTKTIVGGTKNVNIEKIISLKPDLIIANKEENTKEEIESLSNVFPVWVSNILNFTDSLEMILEIGKFVGKIDESQIIVQKIKSSFSSLKPLKLKKKVLYLIWRKPWMSINSDTFIHDMLFKCGFENIVQDKSSRYPELTQNEIVHLNPEVVFLSSEPFPFKEKHIIELKSYLPNAKVLLVDGEAFSWYGSHLLKSGTYFKELIQLCSD